MAGTLTHSTSDVYMELTNMFEDRCTGKSGPWFRLPRSPDMTLLDLFCTLGLTVK